jgi:hypothetical protein
MLSVDEDTALMAVALNGAIHTKSAQENSLQAPRGSIRPLNTSCVVVVERHGQSQPCCARVHPIFLEKREYRRRLG